MRLNKISLFIGCLGIVFIVVAEIIGRRIEFGLIHLGVLIILSGFVHMRMETISAERKKIQSENAELKRPKLRKMWLQEDGKRYFAYINIDCNGNLAAPTYPSQLEMWPVPLSEEFQLANIPRAPRYIPRGGRIHMLGAEYTFPQLDPITL